MRPGDGRSQRWRDRRTDPAWLLLPQRLFLGVTFAYAGLGKLADRSFFDPAAPTSIHAQIAAVRDTSPLGPLLRATCQHATTLGVLIALGEIAVGIATLLGVRVRLAAAGGALISLSLLLTVTWATRPYYYGSDIVFLVCWLPLIAFGDGGLLSLDAALARRAARPTGDPARPAGAAGTGGRGRGDGRDRPEPRPSSRALPAAGRQAPRRRRPRARSAGRRPRPGWPRWRTSPSAAGSR